MAEKPVIPPGVHDPWRIHTPDWEPPPSAKRRLSRAQILKRGVRENPEWDLQTPKQIVLQQTGSPSALIIQGTDDLEMAAMRVIGVIELNVELRQALEHAGFHLVTVQALGAPGTQRRGFYLIGDDAALWNPQVNNATEGFDKLVAAFLQFQQTNVGKRALHRVGVVPVMTK